MRLIFAAPLATAALFVSLAPQAHADLLNGSFESPSTTICESVGSTYGYPSCGHVPGWTGTFQLADDSSGFGFTSPFPDGTQALLLQAINSNPIASQQINVPTSTTYTLSFEDADRPGYSPETYYVELDGSILQTFSPSSSSWTSESVLISTTAGLHTLSFVGIPGNSADVTAGIDAVSLPGVTGLDTPDPGSTPEPASWILTTGAAALLALRKRFCR